GQGRCGHRGLCRAAADRARSYRTGCAVLPRHSALGDPLPGRAVGGRLRASALGRCEFIRLCRAPTQKRAATRRPRGRGWRRPSRQHSRPRLLPLTIGTADPAKGNPMHQPTIEKLHVLRLGAMADALTAQLQQPEIDAMPFAERLALLVDIQHSAMLTAALQQRMHRAGMRQSACMENIDLRTPRGLDRSTMQALASGLWIRQHRNVLISGAAGIGKSWVACALGNQAARDGVPVLYKRLSRLLDELAIARLHGRQARLLKTLARTRLRFLGEWVMVDVM